MEENTKKLFESERVEKLFSLFLLVAVIFVGVLAVRGVGDLFAPRPVMGNTISIEGEGRVTAVPDIATISFTVSEEATTVAAAQDLATKKINTALALLKESVGIDEADIKTTSYNVNPRYSYNTCYDRICPPVEERIIGYSASQTIELKVRDIEKAGDALASLGEAGVSNMYGPSFTVDDMESLRAEARDLAIKDARAKAKVLTKSLGVGIVRVTGYWENNDSYPTFYKAEAMGGDAMMSAPNVSPQIPAGENEIVIRLSVSYEIR